MQRGKSRQIIIQKAATIAEYTESYIILHQRMTNVFYHVLNVSFIFAFFNVSNVFFGILYNVYNVL